MLDQEKRVLVLKSLDDTCNALCGAVWYTEGTEYEERMDLIVAQIKQLQRELRSKVD